MPDGGWLAAGNKADLIMIDLPSVGSKLLRGKSFGEIESVKAVSDLYAPVGGEVAFWQPTGRG